MVCKSKQKYGRLVRAAAIGSFLRGNKQYRPHYKSEDKVFFVKINIRILV